MTSSPTVAYPLIISLGVTLGLTTFAASDGATHPTALALAVQSTSATNNVAAGDPALRDVRLVQAGLKRTVTWCTGETGLSGADSANDSAAFGWVAPVRPLRVLRAFNPPEHRYGPGHRGVDLAVTPGQEVLAPADAVVRFRGAVAGRAVISLTLCGPGGASDDHLLASSFEPVHSTLQRGDHVHAGQVIGYVSDSNSAATSGQEGVKQQIQNQVLSPARSGKAHCLATCVHWAAFTTGSSASQPRTYENPLSRLEMTTSTHPQVPGSGGQDSAGGKASPSPGTPGTRPGTTRSSGSSHTNTNTAHESQTGSNPRGDYGAPTPTKSKQRTQNTAAEQPRAADPPANAPMDLPTPIRSPARAQADHASSVALPPPESGRSDQQSAAVITMVSPARHLPPWQWLGVAAAGLLASAGLGCLAWRRFH